MRHLSMSFVMRTTLVAGLIVGLAAGAAVAQTNSTQNAGAKVSSVVIPGWGTFNWLAPKAPAPLGKLQNAKLVSSDGSSLMPAVIYGHGKWICSHSGAGMSSSCALR